MNWRRLGDTIFRTAILDWLAGGCLLAGAIGVVGSILRGMP